MCFASSARRRGRRRRERNYCYITTMPLFARSSWVLRRSDSSKGRQLGLPSRTSNLIEAGHCDTITFLKKEMFACVPSRLFFSLYFVCAAYFAYFSRVVHKNCRSRYERRYELFGCTGCVNCCTRRRAFTISIFRRDEGYCL